MEPPHPGLGGLGQHHDEPKVDHVRVPGERRPSLVLIKGAPGSGKSSVAAVLASRCILALALDVDVIKHALGGHEADPYAAGLQARRLALAMASQHLRDGHDVFVGQYLAKVDFIEQLEAVAPSCGAAFVETVLMLDARALATRLAGRAARPDRPEHAINNRLARPEDAAALVASLVDLVSQRPRLVTISALGDVEAVANRIEAVTDGKRPGVALDAE